MPMLDITVKFFARFRQMAGTGSTTISLPAGSTLADLLAALPEKLPNLQLTPARTLLSVNREFAAADTSLQHGDEVGIFPPVSGGTGQNKFVLTAEPVNPVETINMVSYPHTGAVVTFTGVVRNISEGKAVFSLEYEAYHDMAIAKMKQVAAEARQQWPDIVDIAIVQRIGHLKVGEVAVAIAVSGGHRNQGCFEACQYAIDRLKEIVPVWKKETGPHGETWVEGDHNPSIK